MQNEHDDDDVRRTMRRGDFTLILPVILHTPSIEIVAGSLLQNALGYLYR